MRDQKKVQPVGGGDAEGQAGGGDHPVLEDEVHQDVAARGLCEKVGMRCEGESVKDRLINSEWVNTVWYARLDEDHRETNSSNPPESAA